jgi:hypothetical protein
MIEFDLLWHSTSTTTDLKKKKKTALRHVNNISEEEIISKNHSHSAVSFSPFNE